MVKMVKLKMPVLALVVLLLIAGAAAAKSECQKCHSDPQFKVTHPHLFAYDQGFQSSVHGVAELECSDCHGGDSGTRKMEKAHKGVLEPIRFDRVPETCGKCHQEQRDAFVTSDHYALLEKDGSAPNCVTCHGAMDMDFIFATSVKTTCLFCHNYETGTAPDVPQEADYILNKINVMKGYKGFVELHSTDQELVGELAARYDALTAKWHRFDLETVGAETKALLGDYRKAKAQAVKDRRQKQ